MIRYISDTHFGHENIISFDGRPFDTVSEMEDELVRRWNSVVEKGDITYILGDFCWTGEKDWCRILDRLNGGKVLIRGNHDLNNLKPALRNKFQDVKDYKEIKDNGRKVILCHYPIMFYKSSWKANVYMLCGHVHDTRENYYLNKWRGELLESRSDFGDSQAKIINVGCMLPYMDYTPRTLDELLEGVK